MSQNGKKTTGIDRRRFLRSSLGAAAGMGILGGMKNTPAQEAAAGAVNKIKEYRTLGRTGFKVSDISLGAGNLSNPDVLAAALDAGINYIDTAEHYARGNSERTIGEVLKKYDRKKIFITTKLNLVFGGGKTKEKLRKRFTACLERLQTDYADCLMIHMTPNVDQIKHEPYHELIRELKAENKVRFSGLSNHGVQHSMAGPTKDDMDKVVLAAAEDGRFDVVLFTYNFIQREKGEKILRACKAKGMGTTLMKTNPVKFYSDIRTMFDRAEKAGRPVSEKGREMMKEYETFVGQAEAFKVRYGLETPVQVKDAAIKFVLSNPDVHAVCPTMNSFDELNAYLPLSGLRLDAEEAAMLDDYENVYGRFYCRHACGDCEPACPHGVPVNTIMRYQHYFEAQGREKHAMEHYAGLSGPNAGTCSSCSGPCRAVCPHGVAIQELLIAAHETLSLP